jgi:pullulanase/glycogen debranching enzyme
MVIGDQLSPKCTRLLNDDTLQVEYERDLVDSRSDVALLKRILLNGKFPLEFSEEPCNGRSFGELCGYFSHKSSIIFSPPPKCISQCDKSADLFLACPMSDWENANKFSKWQLRELSVDGQRMIGLKLRKNSLPEQFPFKFISSDGKWISPNDDTPNVQSVSNCLCNFLFTPSATGANILQYRLRAGIALDDRLSVEFSNSFSQPVNFTPWISSLHSGTKLGAIALGNSTTFRVFAPRATSARVAIFTKEKRCPEYYSLHPLVDGVWHTELQRCLHGYYYYYQFLFSKNGNWAEAPMVLDPYAKATVSSSGPGIILDVKNFAPLPDLFVAPAEKDLIIVEAHLRDLLAKAPMVLSARERMRFSGLEKYVKKRSCYLKKLGINCVELQPIHEFDCRSVGDYHWGYMPANWFSPASAYGKNSSKGSQVNDFKRLVASFHKAGIAVILDVVYNHFGDSGHLHNIDREYYFRHNKSGNLTNFSGCGNDFRTESSMARRLIMDSLEHFIRVYNVDGFRFDLAELLGMDFLDILQKKLKSVKKSIILIAEPWSFRGNIGVAIGRLPYLVWNDEYREFVKNYLLGNGNSDGMRYFLCGSLDFRSKFPSQSVNYIASHDDRGWVDCITENPHNNGGAPTKNDCRRTRLSAAILMLSIGTPMMAAGQDFLFSKFGATNTYNRGDLNALNYKLLRVNHSTHRYFRKLIKFRLSKIGELLRLSEVPSKSYFQFFPSAENSACAILYNADNTFGGKRIIFAINPHLENSTIDFREFDIGRCRMLANEDNFFLFPKKLRGCASGNKLTLPPLSCRLLIVS